MKIKHAQLPGPIRFSTEVDVQPTPPASERPSYFRRPTPHRVRSNESKRSTRDMRDSEVMAEVRKAIDQMPDRPAGESWQRKAKLWLKAKWGLMHKPGKA